MGKFISVEEAAALKGVNAEVLRRLLRDEERRKKAFPSAQPPQGWMLDEDEVRRWKPPGAGRPLADRTILKALKRTGFQPNDAYQDGLIEGVRQIIVTENLELDEAVHAWLVRNGYVIEGE